MLFLLLATVPVVLFAFYMLIKRQMKYFEQRGIKGPKPCFLLGNFLDSIKRGLRENQLAYENEYGPVYGMFFGTKKALSISDPELLKAITVRNFNSFCNRSVVPTGHFSQRGLFSLNDDHWRSNRNVLVPTFSGSKLKQMHELILSAIDSQLKKVQRAAENGITLDAKKCFGTFTMDVIASTGFGIQVDADDEDNEFVRNARDSVTFHLTNVRILLYFVFPWLIKLLRNVGIKISLLNKAPCDFFANIIREAIALRNTPGFKSRKDFLKLMLDAYVDDKTLKEDIKSGHPDVGLDEFGYWTKRGLTMDEIFGNGILFFVGGYESTATTLTFLSYFLAVNAPVQARLHAEVDNVVPLGTDPNYDNVKQLEYLDAAINETLRLMPPVYRLERKCSEEVNLNGSLTVEKGMTINIPVVAIHLSEENFADATQFKPDRFLGQSGDDIKNSYKFMPFGLGPRVCIGQRLAVYEIKMFMAKFLQRFRLEPCAETPVPLKLKKRSIMPTVEGELKIRVVARRFNRSGASA